MNEILACVDRSPYARSVCDHAAWFAGLTGSRVRVLHALESEGEEAKESARELVRDCVDIVRGEGVENCLPQVFGGSLLDAVRTIEPEVIVMGKRGISGDAGARRIGAQAASIIRGVSAPTCLASKLFLPVDHALVVLDADIERTRGVDFVAAHEGLRNIETELIVAALDDEDPRPKVEWARAALSARRATVFSVKADSFVTAIQTYAESRPADLIIVSRAVLFANASAQLRELEARGVWRWRTPVLVC